MNPTIRAAAAQFHVGDDVAANLATCLRAIRSAAAARPDLLVLPEFANHCSWYQDAGHCLEVAVDLDGSFLSAIAQAARDLKAIVVINCTVRRADDAVTGTSLMYSSDGQLLGETDKQVLIGHENDFLQPAAAAGPVLETPLGRLAMYACMDGVINETPRCLALRGAQVLCNSLNSFAIDEGTLHIPVRAAENKVWVVAANKIGPLIPEAVLGPVSEAINIPAHCLHGAGDSQIVAPDGKVLAMAGKAEQLVWADIDVTRADRKTRPDGTDLFRSRRPELYQELGANPAGQAIPVISGPEQLPVAAISHCQGSAQKAAEALREAREAGAALVVLPELLGAAGPDGLDAVHCVEVLAAACGEDTLAACSLPMDIDGQRRHCAVLINRHGLVHQQPQVHASRRAGWSAPGDAVTAVDTGIGRLGILPSDDAIYPEVFRLLAMQGVHTVAVPAAFQESWEYRTGLVERAAENRVNIVAACETGPCTGLIATLQKDFTIMTPWVEREFDGLLSAPEVVVSDRPDPLLGAVHPLAAGNKVCSSRTHLIESRPWRLLQPMTA